MTLIIQIIVNVGVTLVNQRFANIMFKILFTAKTFCTCVGFRV